MGGGSEEATDLRIQSKCHMVPDDRCGKVRVRERVVLSDLKSCLDSRLYAIIKVVSI